MTRTDIINAFIDARLYKRYLEIGVKNGENLINIHAPVRLSVDPDPHSVASYNMTSDRFFAFFARDMVFDVVFIDGLHECSQVDRDIHNSLKHLAIGGVIVLHDCLPTSEPMQRHFTTSQDYVWTGDVWKAFVKNRATLPYLMYTVDHDFGCGVIDTRQYDKPQNLPTDMSAMTYDDFVNHPEWMNKKEMVINV